MAQEGAKVTDLVMDFVDIVNAGNASQNGAISGVPSNRLNSFCTAMRLVVPRAGD
jgi:hypothetical protein